VNNRNLRTLDVDLDASRCLIEQLPKSVVAVAESGLRTSDDLVGLRRLGYDAFLVGEALLTQEHPGRALQALLDKAGSVTRGERRVGSRPARVG
jgi:indole-3-glycerol phosphate synthase